MLDDVLEKKQNPHDAADSILSTSGAGVSLEAFRDDTVNVVAAHTFVKGSDAAGSERAAHLVEAYGVSATSVLLGFLAETATLRAKTHFVVNHIFPKELSA